ncbi:energy-coupling factor transporter transmembrane protein EcfT [Bacillus sp. FJAT-47783]|uniref:energy-coupling factor transporter transmembrane component T family protein n=1 Tax=Bacillus sp. FJAT-47783 TaxID=2922712 RepID=UPI001FAD1810|nr:energy-coupling factor transporter transmembrane protein EcfT [Bacillus sp. FJAT-47783]
MMNSMIIGKYVPGVSVIHKMDPRAKLIFVFSFVIVVFIANNAVTYSILGAYTLLVVLLTRLPVRFLLNGLKPILWIILFTFILHILFTKEGNVIFSIGFFRVYDEGIQQGVYITLRFIYLILVTTILTLTTTPIEITDGLETLLAPFKKLKLPVHELALMMSISLRFIPTLMEETEKIMKAQMARGTDFSTGTIKKRIEAIIPLLVPLFISAFKRAEELATAMEARGYKGSEGRTKLRQLQWNLKDTFILLTFLIIVVILLLLRS